MLVKGQRQLGPDVKAVAIPHMFNLDTLRWRRGPQHPTAILNSGWTTWDESRRLVWAHSGDDAGGNAFITFSPDGDNGDGTFGRWGVHFPNKLHGVANHNAMQIDRAGEVIIVSVHERDALYAIDAGHPESELVCVQSAGSKPRLRPYAAMEYARNLDRVVYFAASDNGSLYTIAQPAAPSSSAKFSGKWMWRAYEPAIGTTNPIRDAASRSRYPVNLGHTFGRFRIACFAEIDVAVLVRHVDSPVYAMRLN